MDSLDSRQIFELTGNSFRAWHASVETLTQAARRVRIDTPAQLPDGAELMLATNGVYAMLLGYAIECALKGLWVKAGNKLVVAGRYIRIKGAGDHQLGQLGRAVGKIVQLGLTTSELDVLDRLSAFVVYAGRYPIPTAAENTRAVDVPGRGEQVPTFFAGEDFRTAELLLNRFTRALNPFLPPSRAAAT